VNICSFIPSTEAFKMLKLYFEAIK